MTTPSCICRNATDLRDTSSWSESPAPATVVSAKVATYARPMVPTTVIGGFSSVHPVVSVFVALS
jgi:hypothetical protein